MKRFLAAFFHPRIERGYIFNWSSGVAWGISSALIIDDRVLMAIVFALIGIALIVIALRIERECLKAEMDVLRQFREHHEIEARPPIVRYRH